VSKAVISSLCRFTEDFRRANRLKRVIEGYSGLIISIIAVDNDTIGRYVV
jgi:hypothetical protein